MAKIKRFFECLLPVTVCNLECPYCYIIQGNRRTMQVPQLQYAPKHIAKALRKERVGGVCLISICGAGETLAHPEAVELVNYLLREGHYINITTNGTLTSRFERLIETCGDLIQHVHFSFSMHYLELKERNLIESFFENISMVREAGASILLQMNLCDEYIDCNEEIMDVCMKRVGAYPQVALTREERTQPISIYTTLSRDEYRRQGERYQSPLFEFTCENFLQKRKEFCYAGDWSGVLDLQTGIMKKCYAERGGVNIFEDIEKPIEFEALGCNCKSEYCINSSHFLSLGVIPELVTPTYGELRNRKVAGWYTDKMEEVLNSKLSESNEEYSQEQKDWINKKNRISHPEAKRPKAYKLRRWLSKFEFYQWLSREKRKLLK